MIWKLFPQDFFLKSLLKNKNKFGRKRTSVKLGILQNKRNGKYSLIVNCSITDTILVLHKIFFQWWILFCDTILNTKFYKFLRVSFNNHIKAERLDRSTMFLMCVWFHYELFMLHALLSVPTVYMSFPGPWLWNTLKKVHS